MIFKQHKYLGKKFVFRGRGRSCLDIALGSKLLSEIAGQHKQEYRVTPNSTIHGIAMLSSLLLTMGACQHHASTGNKLQWAV